MKTLVPRLLLGIVGLACIGCGRSDVEVITKEVTQTEYQPPPPSKDDEGPWPTWPTKKIPASS